MRGEEQIERPRASHRLRLRRSDHCQRDSHLPGSPPHSTTASCS
jgi:hypothetical protein